MHIQLSLFETILKQSYLEADSPKKAFYRIKITEDMGKYTVKKESGCNAKILHKQAWNFDNQEDALKFYNKKIKEKTKRGRKRIYKRIN